MESDKDVTMMVKCALCGAKVALWDVGTHRCDRFLPVAPVTQLLASGRPLPPPSLCQVPNEELQEELWSLFTRPVQLQLLLPPEPTPPSLAALGAPIYSLSSPTLGSGGLVGCVFLGSLFFF